MAWIGLSRVCKGGAAAEAQGAEAKSAHAASARIVDAGFFDERWQLPGKK